MKKQICAGLAALALAAFSCAPAEEGYVPGRTAASLIGGALTEGKLLGAGIAFSLTGDPDTLGSSLEDFTTVANYLKTFQFYAAAGETPEGDRLELAGRMGTTLDAPGFDASLTFGPDTLYVESSILDDRRLSVGYSALLDLLGVSKEDAKALLAASGTDDLASEIRSCLPQLASALLPYAEEAAAFAAEHAGATADNLEAQDIFPAVDHEYSWTVSFSEAAAFLRTAAGKAGADEKLSALLGAELSGRAASLLDSLAGTLEKENRRSEDGSAERTVSFYAGVCQGAVPAYYVLEITEPDGKSGLDLLFILNHGEEEGTVTARFLIMSAEDDATALPFDSLFRYTPDADDPAGFKLEGLASVDGGDRQYDLQTYQEFGTVQPVETIAGGLGLQSYFSVSDPEGTADAGKTELYAETQAYNTTDSGETLWTAGSLAAVKNDEMTGQETWSANFIFTPSADHGFDGDVQFTLTLPSQGIGEAQLKTALRPVDYDAAGVAALTPVSFEAMTEEERASLLQTVQNNAMQFYIKALQSIPQDVADAADRLTGGDGAQ